jgi:hypothetical protein
MYGRLRKEKEKLLGGQGKDFEGVLLLRPREEYTTGGGGQ